MNRKPESRREFSYDYLTPPQLLADLGGFDLDPCASTRQPWDTAARMIRRPADGLSSPWAGDVWVNPPFSDAAAWVSRLVSHGSGVCILPARVDTYVWHEFIFPAADALYIFRGRVRYFAAGGREELKAPFASILAAFGRGNAERLRGLPAERWPGFYVNPRV